MNGDQMYDWWTTATNDEVALLLAYLADGDLLHQLLTDDSREGLLRTAQALRDQARAIVAEWQRTGCPTATSRAPLYRQIRAAMASMTPERTAQYMAQHPNRERAMDRLEADVRNAKVAPVMRDVVNSIGGPPADFVDNDWDGQS